MASRINVRAKGHRLERYWAQLLKDLGWTNCVSSRSESKRLDDLKVDLCYTHPFQIQAKSVERLGSLHAILASMPQTKDKHNLVVHKKSRQGTLVAMMEEDFIILLKMLIASGAIKPEC